MEGVKEQTKDEGTTEAEDPLTLCTCFQSAGFGLNDDDDDDEDATGPAGPSARCNGHRAPPSIRVMSDDVRAEGTEVSERIAC